VVVEDNRELGVQAITRASETFDAVLMDIPQWKRRPSRTQWTVGC
jgi:hypothetical protein